MARKDDLRDALDQRDRPDPDEPDDDDVDEPDDDSDEPDDDDVDEPDDKDKGTKAPTVTELQAELKRTQDNLRRARREVRRVRNGTRPTGRTDRDEPDDDRDDRRDRRSRDRDATRQADQRATKAEDRALRADAKVALIRAGADPDLVELAASKINLRDIDLDDDDQPILDDWVEDMKQDYPTLFGTRRRGDEDEDDRPARRRRVPTMDQGAAASQGRRSRSQSRVPFGQQVIAAGRAADPSQRRRR